MEIFTSFFLTTIAGLSTCLGYFITLFKVKNIDRLICISLSFASGVMILLSFKELIPSSLKYLNNNLNIIPFFLIFIIIPVIIYIMICLYSNLLSKYSSLYRVGVLNMISLMIHNIPEGIITFLASYFNFTLGFKLILGIIAHNIPEGIAISIPIYYSTKNRKKAFLYTLIAGMSESIGALLVILIFNKFINEFSINILLYIIGCLMLIICIKEILPEIIKYKNSNWILIGILLSLFILII